MKLSTLILKVTADCNFNCEYCFQTKENHYMDRGTAMQAVDFFLPYLEKDYRLVFAGGEPFLALDLIKETISYLGLRNREVGKSARFFVTTNGSLLDDPILEFLNRSHFKVDLSFDGFAQNVGRRKKTFHKTVSLIKKILNLPKISLAVRSTLMASTVDTLYKSFAFILDLGVGEVSFSFDLTRRWNRPSIVKLGKQLDKLRELILAIYRQKGRSPVPLFEKEKAKGPWQCPAGHEQLTVTPAGEIWGCPGFCECFRDKEPPEVYCQFCFGKLEEFAGDNFKHYRKVLRNYAQLRMDNFYTSDSRCFLCPELEECSVCPTSTFSANSPLLYVPGYVCAIRKLLNQQRVKFREAL